MVFLFGMNRPKNAGDLCRSTKAVLLKVLAEEKVPAPLEEEVARYLEEMKAILQGTREKQPVPQQIYQLICFMIEEDLFYTLALSILRLGFDRRKAVQTIMSIAIRFRTNSGSEDGHSSLAPVVKHFFSDRPEALVALCKGFEKNEVCLQCAGILNEALKVDSLAAVILYNEPTEDGHCRGLNDIDPNAPASGKGIFWNFFDYIDKNAFESSAQAFEVFRALLTTHKGLVKHFLLINKGMFLERYHKTLMGSSSYVTKRQSTKLLADILLDRTHYDFMVSYIKDPENLKIAMNLLRDSRRMIAYEAFHVFKIFVADPEKAFGIKKILIMNRSRLIIFLEGFLADRSQECQFNDEKAYLIRTIEQLPTTVPPPPTEAVSLQNHQTAHRSDSALSGASAIVA